MSRLRVASAAVIMMAALAGCAAARFANLQQDYYQLMETKNLCQDGLGPRSVRPISNRPQWMPMGDDVAAVPDDCDVGDDLRLIAKQAEGAAKKGDVRTQIGYLRLASVAAWQADDLERTVELSLEGQKKCQSIGKDAFGAPRDCAILSGVGALAQADLTSKKIDEIEPLRRSQQAEWIREASDVRTNLESSARNLQQARSHIRDIPGIDATVTVYFDRQYRLLYCNYANLTARAFTLRDAAVTQHFSDGLCAIQANLDVPKSCDFPGDPSPVVECQ